MNHLKRTPSAKGAPQNRQSDNTIYEPVKLTLDEYTALEKLIPESSKQFRRMVKHLAFNPDSETTKVCIATASVNLSDLAHKHNHLIQPTGLIVDCRKPPYIITNRFGERSNQFLWGLYRIGSDK